MKKIKLISFTLICFFMIFCGRVLALQTTEIKSVKERLNFKQDGIVFEDLKFDFYGKDANELIGFMGPIENKNSDSLELQFDIKYYDANKKVIAVDIKNYEASGNSTQYYNLHTSSSKLGIRAKDIKYYQISYEILSGSVDYNGKYEDAKDSSNINEVNDNQIANEPKNNEDTKEVPNINKIDDNQITNDKNSSEDMKDLPNINEVNDNQIVNVQKPSENALYSLYDYVIDKYDINIVVNENNTFDITENITAYFNGEKHGIYRKIPLKNTITRLDGTKSTNTAQISNVSVNNEYIVVREDGNYEMIIGSPKTNVTGEQHYVIKYTYNIGKDPIKDYDELYYNIIGNDWNTVIGGITFTITMPKAFDSSKLGFSSGSKGSTDNSNIEYSVNGNVITGKYNGVLGYEEGLTVRTELPEGYFVGAGLNVEPINYIIYSIPLVFLIVAIFLWYKFGRDEQVVETVEFYPPTGFNSLEVGFLYKGHADNRDVVSLLIYLANKGYIKIEETEEESLFSKVKGFRITKLKEYDGDNINEKLFLSGLFKSARANMINLSKVRKLMKEAKLQGDKISFTDALEMSNDNYDDLNSVTNVDLYNNFYITMNGILSNVNNKENKNKIFEKKASIKTILIIAMIVITYCLITIKPVVEYNGIDALIFALLFPGIGFSVLFGMLFRKTSAPEKIFSFIWGLGFGGIPFAFLVLPALQQLPIYLIGYIIGIASVLGMVLCIKAMPKRTPYGNEMLGKLKGFKNFLETAEKDKLESMVFQDPSYFYDILPYTYVLGISDKWIKKFEEISLQAPSWYEGPTGFDVATFGTFMNSTMASAQSSMSSSPSSSSGGSSGGGSSGGGSGGGGGGSW